MSKLQIKHYDANAVSVPFETQLDKLHHVAHLHPQGDAIGALHLQSVDAMPHVQSLRLMRGSSELARVTRAQLLAANEPQYQSWRIPLLAWNEALSMHYGRSNARLRVVLETSSRWDSPARLGYTLAFCAPADCAVLQSSERALLRGLDGPRERPLRTAQWAQPSEESAQSAPRLPEPTPAPALRKSVKVMPLAADGVSVRIPWPLLLERVEARRVGDSVDALPVFHLLCDGRASAQSSTGGALLCEGLQCYAGSLLLPYTGAKSLAKTSASLALGSYAERALACGAIDGSGLVLRFREQPECAEIELTLYHWAAQ